MISAIHDKGGDMLKLIGDGVLTCRRALLVEAKMCKHLAELSAKRREEGPKSNSVFNISDVFYGNIGSKTRLDFTVIGPAVNEVSRIVALCRSVDRSNPSVIGFRRRDAVVPRCWSCRPLRCVSRAQILYAS